MMHIVFQLIDMLPISGADRAALTMAVGAFWLMEMARLFVWMATGL